MVTHILGEIQCTARISCLHNGPFLSVSALNLSDWFSQLCSRFEGTRGSGVPLHKQKPLHYWDSLADYCSSVSSSSLVILPCAGCLSRAHGKAAQWWTASFSMGFGVNSHSLRKLPVLLILRDRDKTTVTWRQKRGTVVAQRSKVAYILTRYILQYFHHCVYLLI